MISRSATAARYELHDVALEYGAKPRVDEPARGVAGAEDIPF